MTPHDEWDFDGVNENILFETRGEAEAAGALRSQRLRVHDRSTTGKLIVANKYGPVNWASKIDLATGVPGAIRSTARRRRRTPRAFARRRSASRISSRQRTRRRRPLLRSCQQHLHGLRGCGSEVRGGPALRRRDRAHVRRAGRKPRALHCLGSHERPTGVGDQGVARGLRRRADHGRWLVFYGTMEGWLKAVDAKTGKVLWKFKTPSGIIGNPMTYVGPDGRQYVAVLSGIGGWAGIGIAAGIGAEDPTAGLGAPAPSATRASTPRRAVS